MKGTQLMTEKLVFKEPSFLQEKESCLAKVPVAELREQPRSQVKTPPASQGFQGFSGWGLATKVTSIKLPE